MRVFMSVAMVLALGACAKNKGQTEPDAAGAPPVVAHALLLNGEGEQIGTVSANQLTDGIELIVSARVIGGAGPRGFHVHEGSTCGTGTFADAGGHFNPYATEPHGGPESARHHAGDMGNVMADADGQISEVVYADGLSLLRGKTQAIGHPIIIHSGRDDLSSQPAGDAGKRVACGVLVPGMLPETM